MGTIGYFIDNFQNRIKYDKNPILIDKKAEKPCFYYEFEKNSIILHKTKNYKGFQRKIPDKILLEKGINISDLNENTENRDKIISSQAELLRKKAELQENTDFFDKNEKKPLKKGFIEEIPGETEEISNKPSYNLLERIERYEVEILMPKVEKFMEIDLKISEKQLNLEVKSKYALFIAFPHKIDNNAIEAKWLSKSKKLRLFLNKIF